MMRLMLRVICLLLILTDIQACRRCGEEEEIILNCYGKYFHCINETHFYQCANYGPITLAFSSQTIQVCPTGLICSSTNNWECVEPSESSTTTECPPEESSSEVTTTIGTISTTGGNHTDITFTITPSTAHTTESTESNTTELTSSAASGISETTTERETSSSTQLSSEGTPASPDTGATETTTKGQSSTSSTEGVTSSSTQSSSESTPASPDTGATETTTEGQSSSSSTEGVTSSSTQSSSESTPASPDTGATETTTEGQSSSSSTEGVTSSSTSRGETTTDNIPSGSSETSTENPVSNSTDVLSTTTTIVEESSTSESSTKPTVPPEFACVKPGRFPDPRSCSVYHICINLIDKFIDLPGSCPKGTLFDRYSLRCTTSPVQCPGEPSLTCDRNGIFAHPNKCNRYYVCSWNYIYNIYDLKQYLCSPFFRYDERQKKCVPSTACKPDKREAFKCTDVGFFPVEYNCKNFYSCEVENNNSTLTPVLKTCGEDALFDRARRKCRTKCLVTNCPYNTVDIE